MRSVRSRARRLRGFVVGLWLAVGVLTSTHAWAQSDESSPEEQYHRRININQDITPLGEDPFGEQVNLYTGELSFEQTDIVVHGNGPDIVIARSFSPGWRNTNGTAPDDGEFADWQLDLPRLTSMANKNTGQIAAYGNFAGVWQVGSSTVPDDRCSQMALEPRLYESGTTNALPMAASGWWHGYQLNIPGQGAQNILTKEPGVRFIFY